MFFYSIFYLFSIYFLSLFLHFFCIKIRLNN
nr:MAG TPA: hypothetical protein [Caudoviricetes sp.]